MNLLLFIVSAIMTWTVDSKTAVQGDGTFPSYDMTVNYNCTYQKGTVRSGDEAVLRLGNMGAITIDYVDVYVKSNQESGAGTFTVSSKDKTLSVLSGSFKDWTGAYDNSSYHAVRVMESAAVVDELTVQLTGLANSLYIEKYVIAYRSAPVYTVTLKVANQVYKIMTETNGGTGVVLPELMLYEYEDWMFVGWSERAFSETKEKPEVYAPWTLYHPTSDITMWAVFRQKEEAPVVYASALVSGDYLYVNSETGKALCGTPDGGKMYAQSINVDDSAQIYTVTFESASTAYITHKKTHTPIGYSGTQLAAIASPWSVYHDGEETLFYMKSGTKTYVLWLNIMSGGSYYTGLFNAPLGTSPMRLQLPRQEPIDATYSCYPDGGMDVTQVQGNPRETSGERVLMRFGRMVLVVKEGRKEIRMEN